MWTCSRLQQVTSRMRPIQNTRLMIKNGQGKVIVEAQLEGEEERIRPVPL